MATPSVPERRLMAAGIKKGASWGTAIALGAGFGALLEGDGGLTQTQPYLPANEADSPMALEGDLGPVNPITFAPVCTLRYDPGGWGIATALFFGTAGAPTDLTGAYKHTFQWADEIYGLWLTYAEEKVSKIYEVDSAKPTALDITVTDGLLKGSLSLLARELNDDSTINTATQMDALTYADRGNRIKFPQTTIKINDESAGDVASETHIETSDMTIHYERPHDSPHKAGSDAIIEPAENAHPIITISLTFPRMSAINNVFFTTDFKAETEQKLLIESTGALITGANYYKQSLFFPRMRITAVDYPWDEVIPGSMTLQAEEAASAPTGMSYKRPYIELTNLRSTDYLA